MQPTNDRYQRYAESLDEPVTDDLKAFVDNLDAPYTSAPLPDALVHFTPSSHFTQQEPNAMSLPPAEFIPAGSRRTPTLAGGPPPRSRVSVGLIAALILIVVVAGGFALRALALPRAGQAAQATPTPRVNVTVTTAPAAQKVYVRCLGISVQDPAPNVTNCNTVPLVTSVALHTLVEFTYCFASDIPLPSASLITVTGPDGHGGLGWTGLPVGQFPCTQFGLLIDNAGQYTTRIYWSLKPNATKPRQPPDPTTDHTWQLQLTANFSAQ